MDSFQSQVNEQAMQQAAICIAMARCMVGAGVVDPHELENQRLKALSELEQRYSKQMEFMRGWVPIIDTGDET